MERMRLLVACALVVSAPALAGYDDLVKAACAKGEPWRLPRPTGGMTTSEVFVKLDGTAGVMIRICNCTADVPGRSTSVWVRSEATATALSAEANAKLRSSPNTWPYQLPQGSCMFGGGATISLGPTDREIETWGVISSWP